MVADFDWIEKDYSWIQKDCQEGTFVCEDRSCIPRRWRCNAVSDCSKASDERGCDSCPEGFFFCSEKKCIESYRVCDGETHCAHGEDENKCEEKKEDACKGFQCLSGRCLHSTFFCDGIYDCDEGEDELLCVTKDAAAHEFRQFCSRYYTALLEIHNETRDFAARQGNQECPLDDYNETASWSPMCSSEVFCDNFGCYDYELKKYLEFRSTEYDAICAYCTKDFNCWRKDWVDSWEQSSLNKNQLSWILKKKRSDFRDITSLYEPTTEVLEDASIPKEDFIFSCNFDGKSCSDKDFYEWIDRKYGKCYTFNYFQTNKSIKTLMEAGPTHNLQVDVNLFNGLFIVSPAHGLRVILHSPRRLPFPDEEGFNVGNEFISVSVSRTVIEHYGEDYGFCRGLEKDEFPAYSQMFCKKLCKEREYRRLCGCAVNTGPNYEQLDSAGSGSGEGSEEPRNLSLCSNFHIKQKVCKAVVDVRYKTKKLNCDCPPACREELYKPQVTSAMLSSKYRTILHNYRKKIDTLCKNKTGTMVSLQVYLDSLSYEVFYESPSFTGLTIPQRRQEGKAQGNPPTCQSSGSTHSLLTRTRISSSRIL
ncbi:amiloride-sensitive sodium channel subunit alpha-like isoform X2 [Macrobrachium nipponense]|uniref:amiloride-sensitive sodium channel subunit alpha-like isoform X2 n=1 Tax=Macrobrachium nipponense TaxID=159736 RepID=UPI0030C86C9B